MIKNRPIAIDLFAGAGGLSLGLEQAGFNVLAAVEIDPIHACIHKFNFPSCAVIARPVEHVDAALIRKSAGIDASTKIDLVAGGAPCQGFSLIGQRALDDPRNQLVKEFVRIVNDVKPRYFLFENVKGLTVGKHRAFLDELVNTLQRIGYEVLLPWKVLNAKNYQVPQSRERLFLIGCLKGEKLPTYPHPNPNSVTCKEALDDLPDVELFEKLRQCDEVEFHYKKRASGYSAIMRCCSNSSWKKGYKRKWNSQILTSSLRTEHTEISRQRFIQTTPGTVEKISRFFKLPPDGVSNTLRAGTDSARGAFTSPRPIHYQYPRCITVREMARLHSFPDWFRFHETKWHGARQIGNAVPPLLAYAIGQEIISALGIQVDPPNLTLELGDPSLLRMDMSEASKYWEINVPIATRNRKSGKKKRSQLEVEALNSVNG